MLKNLDSNNFNNDRSNSNLLFISKTLEQLQARLVHNNLYEPFLVSTAVKQLLLKSPTNSLLASGTSLLTILIFLDLTGAFVHFSLASVTHGVPQGSELEPLQFVIVSKVGCQVYISSSVKSLGVIFGNTLFFIGHIIIISCVHPSSK